MGFLCTRTPRVRSHIRNIVHRLSECHGNGTKIHIILVINRGRLLPLSTFFFFFFLLYLIFSFQIQYSCKKIIITTTAIMTTAREPSALIAYYLILYYTIITYIYVYTLYYTPVLPPIAYNCLCLYIIYLYVV